MVDFLSLAQVLYFTHLLFTYTIVFILVYHKHLVYFKDKGHEIFSKGLCEIWLFQYLAVVHI